MPPRIMYILTLAIAVAVGLLLVPQPPETAMEIAVPLVRSYVQTPDTEGRRTPVDETQELLQGYTILITGPTSGIGRGLATVLSELGASVIGIGRSKVALQALQDQGILSDFVTADLADLQQVAEAANQLLLKNQTIDILVANAGMHYGWTTFDNPQSVQGLEKLFAVNYVSHVLLIEKLTPLLLQQSPNNTKKHLPRVLYVNSFFHFAVHASDLIASSSNTKNNQQPRPMPPSWIYDAHNNVPQSSPHPFFRDQYNYGASKVALLLHAAHFARRYHNQIHVVSADPGWTATNLNGQPGTLLHLPFQWMGFPVDGWGLQSILAALFATHQPPEPSQYFYANARNYAILPTILHSSEWMALPTWLTHQGFQFRDWFVVLQGFILGFLQRQYTQPKWIMPVAQEIRDTRLQDKVHAWTMALVEPYL